jgi:hypothetical protein
MEEKQIGNHLHALGPCPVQQLFAEQLSPRGGKLRPIMSKYVAFPGAVCWGFCVLAHHA